MAESATATVRIPVSAASYAAAIEGLTRINERILRRAVLAGHGSIPRVYDGRVRYKREPRDVWRHVGDVVRSGWGDCEDLAAWRAAELRVSGEDPAAHVAVYQSGPRRYHAIVARGDGSTEDPSRRLGMKPGGRSPMGTLEGDDYEDEDPNVYDDDPYAELPPEEAEETDVTEEPPEELPESFATYEEPVQYDTPEEPFERAIDRGEPVDAWPETRPAMDRHAPPPPMAMMPMPRPPAPRRKPKKRKPKKRKPKKRKPKKTKVKRAALKVLKAAALPHVFAHKAAFKFGRRLFGRKKRKRRVKRKAVKQRRRMQGAAIAGYCEQHMQREPLGTQGAWVGIGDDPNVGAGPQITFDLYRSGQGWSGIVRVPLSAIPGRAPQAIVAKTTPTKARRMRAPTPARRQAMAKRRTATKAIRLASKISRLPGVQMLIPPPARAALAVLKSPIGRLATKGAGKLLSKLF